MSIDKLNKGISVLAIAALIGLLSACGGGSSNNNVVEGTSSEIAGVVSKGPVDGATIYLYLPGPDGNATGEPVAGPFTTAPDGSWSGDIDDDLARPLVVVATGGTYTDEATGNPVEMDTRSLRSYLPEGASTAAVTPLTELLVQVTQREIANGSGNLTEALGSASTSVKTTLGITFDPLTTQPVAIEDVASANQDQRTYTALLAGLSHLAQTIGGTADSIDVVMAVIEDMSDGTLDGMNGEEPVVIAGSEETLSDTLNNTDLIAAINDTEIIVVSDDGEGNLVVNSRYRLGGTVNGLAGTGLVLQTDIVDAETLAISADGSFNFPDLFNDSTPYTVTISAQPTVPSQTCSVTNGSGTISADVTNITISCETDIFSISATVEGLSEPLEAGQSLILQNNSGDDLEITRNGQHTFSAGIIDLEAYNVTVSKQPENGQICAVTNGLGSVSGADITDVSVNCGLVNITLFTNDGTVSTDGGQISDGQLVLLLQPTPGYVVADVTVSGTGCDGIRDGNTYTLTLGSEACSVEVSFEETPLGDAVWNNFNWDEAIWQ